MLATTDHVAQRGNLNRSGGSLTRALAIAIALQLHTAQSQMSMAGRFRGEAGIIPVESQRKGAVIWLVQHNDWGEWAPLKPDWVEKLENYMGSVENTPDANLCVECEHWYKQGKASTWKCDTYTMDLREMTQTNKTSGTSRPLLRCIVEPPSSVAALQKIRAKRAAPSQRDSGMPSGNGGGGAGSAGDGQSKQEECPEVCTDCGTVEHDMAEPLYNVAAQSQIRL